MLLKGSIGQRLRRSGSDDGFAAEGDDGPAAGNAVGNINDCSCKSIKADIVDGFS